VSQLDGQRWLVAALNLAGSELANQTLKMYQRLS